MITILFTDRDFKYGCSWIVKDATEEDWDLMKEQALEKIKAELPKIKQIRVVVCLDDNTMRFCTFAEATYKLIFKTKTENEPCTSIS